MRTLYELGALAYTEQWNYINYQVYEESDSEIWGTAFQLAPKLH